MITIYDVTNGAPGERIYPVDQGAVIYQKDFVNAFTTFAAAATGKNLLEQGHKYRVRLQYLLAPVPGYQLTSNVSDLQLIIVRARE